MLFCGEFHGVSGFLRLRNPWKLNCIVTDVHSAYRLGNKWKDIPNVQDRAECSLCGAEETMEHILLLCQESTATKTVWELAEKLWRLRDNEWPDITFGTILGCGLQGLKQTRRLTAKGRNRLFTILISESAHLIWKVRCERIIKREDDPARRHTKREITNKWLMIINTRLKLDKMYINKKRYSKKAMRKSLVEQTWRGVLMDEQNLRDNWVWQSGGLAGIGLLRS